MSLASYEFAYSMIFGSSMLGLIFGYLNYYSVISINVTAEGKPELKEYLLNDNEFDQEKDRVPRSKTLVESLTNIAKSIEEVCKCLNKKFFDKKFIKF